MVKIVKHKYDGQIKEIDTVPLMLNELPRKDDHIFLGGQKYVVKYVEWKMEASRSYNCVSEVHIVVW